MKFVERAWYSRSSWLIVLWPLQWLFTRLAQWRRVSLSRRASVARVPVVVVGNISVGGTGKTPLLIALVKQAQGRGLRVGVVSRGYGSKAPHFPVAVSNDTSVELAGDEALIIARQCACPVFVDPNRPRAIHSLTETHKVDVVFSDDGLQHYAMARDIEVIVIDGERQFGNGLCLPAGPLREPLSRLGEADLVVVNGSKSAAASLRETLVAHGVVWASSGVSQSALDEIDSVAGRAVEEVAEGFAIRVVPDSFINLVSGEKRPYEGAPFKMGSRLQAVSGLGNPERFYSLLEALPHQVSRNSFADHHWFTRDEFDKLGLDKIQPIVMTEKDAVKIVDFAESNYWYLTIRIKLPERFLAAFDKRLSQAIKKSEARRVKKGIA